MREGDSGARAWVLGQEVDRHFFLVGGNFKKLTSDRDTNETKWEENEQSEMRQRRREGNVGFWESDLTQRERERELYMRRLKIEFVGSSKK